MVHYPFATEEQKGLAETARLILDKELLPKIEELEKTNGGMGQYPMDVHNILAEQGFYGMNIPEEWGGLGLDMVTIAIILEEMAQVDAAFTFSFYSSGSYYKQILNTKMPKEVKQDWLNRVLEGKAIGCLCITESEAGSDVAAMRTTAVKDGDEWVINGTKCFITNGTLADYFLVCAWTDKNERASNGMTFFFVEKGQGVQVAKKENKMGFKLSETCDIVLDNVRVPEDHVIGEVGKGLRASISRVDESRTLHGAYSLGLAQTALDKAVEYAKLRRTFGKRIIDHQGLGFTIADMQARIDATRALLYQTINMVKDGTSTGRYSAALKLTADQNVMQTAVDALQVFGGYGYMKDYPMEKLFRDAKLFQIFGGSDQILRNTIAKSLAGKDEGK